MATSHLCSKGRLWFLCTKGMILVRRATVGLFAYYVFFFFLSFHYSYVCSDVSLLPAQANWYPAWVSKELLNGNDPFFVPWLFSAICRKLRSNWYSSFRHVEGVWQSKPQVALHKLSWHGVFPALTRWFHCSPTDRKSSVQILNWFFDAFVLSSGVPHESSLGPLFFLFLFMISNCAWIIFGFCCSVVTSSYLLIFGHSMTAHTYKTMWPACFSGARQIYW